MFDILDDPLGQPMFVGLKDLLQNVDFSSYWNYDGSVTQPPCTEDIKWTVIKDVQSISPNQLKRIRDSFASDPKYNAENGNNRAVQPIEKRKVHFSGAHRVLFGSISSVLLTLFLVFF